MQIIVDFTPSQPNGKMVVVPQSRLLAAALAGVLLLAVLSTALAFLVALYWVQSDSALIRDIAAKEIHAQNEDRSRLWQESIGTLQEDIAALNARVIELYGKGASLSDHLGLPGEQMFRYNDIAGDGSESFLCPAGGGEVSDGLENISLHSDDNILTPEEKQIQIADFLHRQHRQLDELERKFVSLRQQSMENLVLESTIPLERPVLGRNWVSSGYGYRRDPFTGRRAFHAGQDYAARRGTPIIAGADGIVIYAGRLGRYGNTVQIYHGGEVSTLYGHMHKIHVKVWQHVTQGETIGTVGSTGRSTGPHLHYEVRINNRPKSVRKTIKQLRAQHVQSSNT